MYIYIIMYIYNRRDVDRILDLQKYSHFTDTIFYLLQDDFLNILLDYWIYQFCLGSLRLTGRPSVARVGSNAGLGVDLTREVGRMMEQFLDPLNPNLTQTTYTL